MNYLELTQEVCKRIQEDVPESFGEMLDDDSYFPVLAQLNDSLKLVFFEDSYRFREKNYSFDLVAGEYQYDIPVALGTIDEYGLFLNNNSIPLPYLKSFTLNEQIRNNNNPIGCPSSYSIVGNQIWFNTLPDAEYTCRIYYLTDYPAVDGSGNEKLKLELETDEPNFNEKWQDLIVLHACSPLRSDYPNDQIKFERLYNDMKSTLIDSIRGTLDARPKLIKTDTSRVLSYQGILGGNNRKLPDDYVRYPVY